MGESRSRPKLRKTVFFAPETWRALEDHARRHPELARDPRGMTASQSAEYLVRRALFDGAGDGLKELLRRVVCEELRAVLSVLPASRELAGGRLPPDAPSDPGEPFWTEARRSSDGEAGTPS